MYLLMTKGLGCFAEKYKMKEKMFVISVDYLRNYTLTIMFILSLSSRLTYWQWRTQEFFRGGVQQIQLRAERMGIWGW
jgi:hypothetical protein